MKLTGFHLKCIACGTMLLDHIGAALFPQFIFLRIIGRLAFPIFAFLLAEGYVKTKNIRAYIIRMALFAALSQIPFYLAFSTPYYFNVFFTLTAALIAMVISDRTSNPFVVLAVAFVCQYANTDWGAFGVILPYVFYRFRGDWPKLMFHTATLTLIFDASYLMEYYYRGVLTPDSAVKVLIHLFSLVSLFIIRQYQGQRGPNLKYTFYAFYPVHLLAIAFFKFH